MLPRRCGHKEQDTEEQQASVVVAAAAVWKYINGLGLSSSCKEVA